jgi:hypothetical protein
MKSRTRLWAALVIGLTSLIVLGGRDPVRVLPTSAQRFVAYYQAFGASDAKAGPWQRVLFSFAMASSPSGKPEGAGAGHRPRPSRPMPTAF